MKRLSLHWVFIHIEWLLWILRLSIMLGHFSRSLVIRELLLQVICIRFKEKSIDVLLYLCNFFLYTSSMNKRNYVHVLPCNQFFKQQQYVPKTGFFSCTRNGLVSLTRWLVHRFRNQFRYALDAMPIFPPVWLKLWAAAYT